MAGPDNRRDERSLVDPSPVADGPASGAIGSSNSEASVFASLSARIIKLRLKTCADRISGFIGTRLCGLRVHVGEGVVVDGECRGHDLVAVGGDPVKT
jgi:hypothetical protein